MAWKRNLSQAEDRPRNQEHTAKSRSTPASLLPARWSPHVLYPKTLVQREAGLSLAAAVSAKHSGRRNLALSWESYGYQKEIADRCRRDQESGSRRLQHKAAQIGWTNDAGEDQKLAWPSWHRQAFDGKLTTLRRLS